MPINRKIIRSADGETQFNLDIQFNGLDVTVKAGPVRFEHQDLALIEDEDVTIQSSAEHPTVVMGYLVRDRQDGDRIRVFVDVYVQDGVDEMYIFTRASRFEGLAHLFLFDLPPGATDIVSDSPGVTTFAVLPFPAEPQNPDAEA
jgi:hypothetical protein